MIISSGAHGQISSEGVKHMNINDNIRRLRMEAGLSQEELSEKLGVSRQAVSKWENGVTSPDISLLPLLAGVLDVTVDSLFAGDPARGYEAYGSYRGKLLARTSRADVTESDFRRVIEAYSEVIMAGNASTEDYVDCGMLFFRRARYDIDVAVRYFRRAISEGNDHRDIRWLGAHKQLFHVMKELNRMDEALSEARAWAEREPDCCWSHSHLSLVLEEMGLFDEAYEEVMRALAIDPDDVDALTGAGDICCRLERYEEAVSCWDRAYEADPTSISCWFSKAEAYVKMGRPKEAIGQYRRILSWLEEKGYDMEMESQYPLQRIREIEESMTTE